MEAAKKEIEAKQRSLFSKEERIKALEKEQRNLIKERDRGKFNDDGTILS